MRIKRVYQYVGTREDARLVKRRLWRARVKGKLSCPFKVDAYAGEIYVAFYDDITKEEADKLVKPPKKDEFEPLWKPPKRKSRKRVMKHERACNNKRRYKEVVLAFLAS
ncbi:hypothetical protein [Balnearium lithotrophicum]|uniref:hypothetical protein n=1 Tax=Balnearium lithotrophicum TaxID=223788 RepID=UPI001C8F295D|nr:hypothetical protein [Balnearium lithotrophicum]